LNSVKKGGEEEEEEATSRSREKTSFVALTDYV